MPIDYQFDIIGVLALILVNIHNQNRLIVTGYELGLNLKQIKHGYNPGDYEGLVGISRDEIRDSTRYTLKQVGKSLERLKSLELVIPDEGDNGRYYYQNHFRLPFIDHNPYYLW